MGLSPALGGVPKDAAVSAATSFASPQTFSDSSHPMFPGKGVSLSQSTLGSSGKLGKAELGGNPLPSFKLQL